MLAPALSGASSLRLEAVCQAAAALTLTLTLILTP